jgi:hypothetical protein
MTTTVKMFCEGAADERGRTLASLRDVSDQEFEASHDFIQTMFPLMEKSMHHKDSPVLTDDDVKQLIASRSAVSEMALNLIRLGDFLGVSPGRYDEAKQAWWCNDGNHNLLRVTRVIRSIRLFGSEVVSKQFCNIVTDIATKRGVNETTKQFWWKAAHDPINASLTEHFLKLRGIEL